MEEIIEKGRNSSERLVALIKKRGADDVVVSFSSRKSSQVKFSNNKISANMIYHDNSLSVFASFNKRIVSTSLKSFDEKALEKSADFLSKFARAVEPNKNYMGIAQGPFKYKKTKGLFDPKVEKLGDKVIDQANSAINSALKGRVERTAGTIEASTERNILFTSNNVEAEERSTGLYLSIRALVDKNDSGHMVSVSRTLSGFNGEKCASDAAELANMKAPVKTIFPGKYDIIFYPLPFAVMLDLAANACSIFDVESGFSFFENKLGKRVAGKNFTLIDDASTPYGFGSSLFDDEGMPSQKNVLINNGVLKTYLHNTSTAMRYKTKSTASAGLVAPQPSNIILEKGKASLNDMVSSVKRGLIVTNLWYTRFQNYKTGDFSTIPRDKIFVVENGRITAATKGIRIADSMNNLLGNVSSIGNDSKQILGWEVETPVTTPSVLAKNINISMPLKE